MTAPGAASLRVHFVTHWSGHRTGTLLRTWQGFFDRPAPAAFGVSEEDILGQLEIQLLTLIGTDEDSVDRYLWDDTFAAQTITVDVHPQSTVKKRSVIGRRSVPLTVTYLSSKMAGGGFRILLPRFGWWFVVEDLSIARDVVRQAIGTVLLGEAPRSLYDFRLEGDEYVRTWSPRLAARRNDDADDDEDTPTLRLVADELVARAARGKLPVSVAAGTSVDEILPHVVRNTPPSLLLVGGHGVGKTTWVHALARRLVTAARTDPRGKARRPPRIWATSDGRILSGMKYLGMWQARCLTLVEELSTSDDYLFVDRLGPLVAPQPDGSSIADVFLPAMLGDQLHMIAECTDQELERLQRRAPSLVACFQIVRIPEPRASEVLELLAVYEARREPLVRLHAAGRKRLVRHLELFRRDVSFPGKAIRFMDWLHQEGARDGRARLLYPRDVSEAYARYSGLPLELIADEVPVSAEMLATKLRARVVGQDAACAAAARVLARFKAGLNDPERPTGTLLFVGPTGVGKTELAKQLARTMFGDETRMIRLDMSEYMLPGSSARLLDTTPGSTSLAQRVRQEPLSLVLFDEIEKADPEIFDVLLGILGEGRLADAEGRAVDFRMALIVMTSNLGVASARGVGFHDDAGASSLQRVRAHFRPELFNRIDHVIPFQPLAQGDMLAIVDLELAKASARTGLVRRNLRLRVDAAARARLAVLGFDPARGARPLTRVIEEHVVTPLAVRIAADPALRDRDVLVGVDGAGDQANVIVTT